MDRGPQLQQSQLCNLCFDGTDSMLLSLRCVQKLCNLVDSKTRSALYELTEMLKKQFLRNSSLGENHQNICK